MLQQVINIPTINDTPADFVKLFLIWRKVNGRELNIKFDFSNCGFLRPNAVAFLGGLARLIESRLGRVEFDWQSCSNVPVLINLCQNGFAGSFLYSAVPWKGDSIPYREDSILDMNGIMDYLTDYWLGQGWVNVSKRLRDAIVGRMWEIYNNAFEHSGSGIGLFACGQRYKTNDELILSVVDFGQGIPNKVRSYLSGDSRAQDLTAAACLRWAVQPGNSTCLEEVPRGLGLDLLKEFIQLNNGKMEIYSNEGYAIIDKEGERFDNHDIFFEGTLVNINLHCDETRYFHFKDEEGPSYNKEI